jgi:hypothetical protein
LVDPGGGVALHGAGPVNDDGRRRKVQDGLQSLPSFHRQLVVVGSISIWIFICFGPFSHDEMRKATERESTSCVIDGHRV